MNSGAAKSSVSLLMLLVLVLPSLSGCGKDKPGESTVQVTRQVFDAPAPEEIAAEMNGYNVRLEWQAHNPGDYNGDGAVDGMDLFRVSTRFGQPVAENPDNVCIDGNDDGTINGMDVFLIAANFLNRIDGFHIYKRADGADEPGRVTLSPVPYQEPISPACSWDFIHFDTEQTWGVHFYSISSTWETGGESPRSPETEIDIRGEGTVSLEAGEYSPEFTGTDPVAIGLTATPAENLPSSYSWSSDGGWFENDETLDGENMFFIDWRDAGRPVTVTVTADFDGWLDDDSVVVQLADHQGPVIDHQYVDGDLVDGGFIGTWMPGENFHTSIVGIDPDGGEVSYHWSVDDVTTYMGDHGLVNSRGIACYTPDTTPTVTITISDNNGGQDAVRVFSFSTSGATPPDNCMRMRRVPTEEPGTIRILYEIGLPEDDSKGIFSTLYWHEDKLTVGPEDVTIHPDNPWPDAVAEFFPAEKPTTISWRSENALRQAAPLFYIDFHIIDGWGLEVPFFMVYDNWFWDDYSAYFYPDDKIHFTTYLPEQP